MQEFLRSIWEETCSDGQGGEAPPPDLSNARLVTTSLGVTGGKGKPVQCDTTDLYDPAFMCSPDNADLGGVFIVPINGPVPIVIMAGSVQHYEQYRAMVPYAFPLLRKLTVKQSIPPTRDAQDRVLATILSRSDQLTDRQHDYNPVCYVVQPNDAVYVPYSCIVRRGGFLPSDIARQVKTVPSTGSIQIHHFEFHISKAAIPHVEQDYQVDPRDSYLYFPMVNFIPGDHHRPDCGLYERSREPIPTSRMRVWAKDGMVRWDPWNNILWGWPSTSQRAAPPRR